MAAVPAGTVIDCMAVGCHVQVTVLPTAGVLVVQAGVAAAVPASARPMAMTPTVPASRAEEGVLTPAMLFPAHLTGQAGVLPPARPGAPRHHPAGGIESTPTHPARRPPA